MDEFDAGSAPHCAEARAVWMHRLRNAVNNAGVGVTLGRRMLDRGDVEGASEILGHAEVAWAECRELLREPGGPPMRDEPLARPPVEAWTQPTAAPPHR